MPLLSAFRQATQDVHQRASDKRLDKALKANPSAVTLLTKVHTMREVQSLLPYGWKLVAQDTLCLLYTSPSPRDGLLSRMPSSA